jgi:NhaP-type Na+/H+ and K+/H+ antiporter
MLAGGEGLGGIAFENYSLAHGVGTLALAVILFDGGLRTDIRRLRAVLAPAVTLATVGVALTAGIVALFASVLLGLPWTAALLGASIVSSTDAAAVFAVFRARGTRVRERLASTLEVESGSNDPMAVFLTLACLGVLSGELQWGPDVVWLFVRQLALGGAIGPRATTRTSRSAKCSASAATAGRARTASPIQFGARTATGPSPRGAAGGIPRGGKTIAVDSAGMRAIYPASRLLPCFPSTA